MNLRPAISCAYASHPPAHGHILILRTFETFGKRLGPPSVAAAISASPAIAHFPDDGTLSVGGHVVVAPDPASWNLPLEDRDTRWI